MENKPSKQLIKSAAVLSLTAVLAAMPVSADGYALASETMAIAHAETPNKATSISAYAELSCEYGGGTDSGTFTESEKKISITADVYSGEVYQKGDILASQAESWVGSSRVGWDYWYVGMN